MEILLNLFRPGLVHLSQLKQTLQFALLQFVAEFGWVAGIDRVTNILEDGEKKYNVLAIGIHTTYVGSNLEKYV